MSGLIALGIIVGFFLYTLLVHIITKNRNFDDSIVMSILSLFAFFFLTLLVWSVLYGHNYTN